MKTGGLCCKTVATTYGLCEVEQSSRLPLHLRHVFCCPHISPPRLIPPPHRTTHPQLALVDIHLPGISGLDMSWCYSQMLLEGDHVPREGGGATPFFSTAQPGSAVHQQTILIACTGDESTTLQQLQGYGIHDVLPKPVTTKGLRHMLHKWLPRDVSALDSGLPTLQQPAQLQRNSSGIFAGRVLLVEDCEVRARARGAGTLSHNLRAHRNALTALPRSTHSKLLLLAPQACGSLALTLSPQPRPLNLVPSTSPPLVSDHPRGNGLGLSAARLDYVHVHERRGSDGFAAAARLRLAPARHRVADDERLCALVLVQEHV